MADLIVARVEEFPEGARRIVRRGRLEVGGAERGRPADDHVAAEGLQAGVEGPVRPPLAGPALAGRCVQGGVVRRHSLFSSGLHGHCYLRCLFKGIGLLGCAGSR